MEEALTDLKSRGNLLSTALANQQAEQKVLMKRADSIVRGFEEEVKSLSDQKKIFLEDVHKTLKDESTEQCGEGRKSFSAALALKREDFVLQLKKKLDSVKFEMENYAIHELETQLKEREEYFSSITASFKAAGKLNTVSLAEKATGDKLKLLLGELLDENKRRDLSQKLQDATLAALKSFVGKDIEALEKLLKQKETEFSIELEQRLAQETKKLLDDMNQLFNSELKASFSILIQKQKFFVSQIEQRRRQLLDVEKSASQNLEESLKELQVFETLLQQKQGEFLIEKKAFVLDLNSSTEKAVADFNSYQKDFEAILQQKQEELKQVLDETKGILVEWEARLMDNKIDILADLETRLLGKRLARSESVKSLVENQLEKFQWVLEQKSAQFAERIVQVKDKIAKVFVAEAFNKLPRQWIMCCFAADRVFPDDLDGLKRNARTTCCDLLQVGPESLTNLSEIDNLDEAQMDILCSFVDTLFKYFMGSTEYGYESYKIWKSPKLSLFSQADIDKIETGKSIRLCRDDFYEMTCHAADGDRIKDISLVFYQRLTVLTNNYVLAFFYGIVCLNLVIFFINAYLYGSGDLNNLGFLAIIVIDFSIPLLLSRITTYKWFGHSSAIPLARLALLLPFWPWAIIKDDKRSVFLRPGKSIHNSSVYELCNSVINFTLWKKRDILRRDNQQHSAKAILFPTDFIRHYNFASWKKIESISSVSLRVFNWILCFFPRFVLVFFWGWVISTRAVSYSTRPQWTPLAFVTDLTFFAVYLIYLLVVLAVIISMLRLTFHVHHFQITTFKERLNLDRLRPANKGNNTDMKHVLNATKPEQNRKLSHRNAIVLSPSSADETGERPQQWADARDLHEEYLYHQSIINRSSHNWELVLAILSILCLAFFAVALTTFAIFRDGNALILGSTLMIILIFIILRIAVLNADLQSIIATLKSAASADWACYGGREALLADFSHNPISFKILGVEITYTYLITLVTAFVSANLSVVLIVYSSALGHFSSFRVPGA